MKNEEGFFQIDENWKKNWRNMPEFVQKNIKPYRTLIVRFESEEGVQEFAKLIEQKLTKNTKSIWHPVLVRGKNCMDSTKRYVDE